MFYAILLVTNDVIYIYNQWDNVKHSSKFGLTQFGGLAIFLKSIIYLAKEKKAIHSVKN